MFILRRVVCVLLLSTAAAAETLGPAADHHMHAISPTAAAFNSEKPLPAVTVPDEVARLLSERSKRWNDAKALAELFTEDCTVLDPEDAMWIRGREAAAQFLSTRFARAYEITPAVWESDGSMARIAGYYTRPERTFGHVALSLTKGADGRWRIASETAAYRGPYTTTPISADQLVAQLDEAGAKKGAVLSTAYWYRADYENVKRENDWMAQQVARYPDRLAGFCGIDPLQDYAVAEVARCAANPLLRGIKLHLGNARVDLHNPEHVERVGRVFRAANERKMAIVAHLWNGPGYGRADAEIFLNQILPAAPDVPVQLAHFGGGGPGWTDEALAVFADAVTAGDARTKNVYFDLATVADQQTPEELRKLAARIRQIGVHRVLYGSDSAPPNPPTRQGWANFRATVPLTDEELKAIAGNVAPYFGERK
jgi:predicted TIM-barrel fold metal-dependent hydrolase